MAFSPQIPKIEHRVTVPLQIISTYRNSNLKVIEMTQGKLVLLHDSELTCQVTWGNHSCYTHKYQSWNTHAHTHTYTHTRTYIKKQARPLVRVHCVSERTKRSGYGGTNKSLVCLLMDSSWQFLSIHQTAHCCFHPLKDTNHTGSVTSLFKQASFTNLRRDQICVYWIISLSFSKHALSSDAKKYTFLFLQKVNFQTLLQNRIIETYKSHCCFLTHSTLIINSCDMIVVLIWYHLSPQNWNSTAGTYTTNKWPGNVHWEPSWDFYMD